MATESEIIRRMRFLVTAEQILKQPMKAVEVVLALVWLYGAHLLRGVIGFDSWVSRFGPSTEDFLGAIYFGVMFLILLMVLFVMRKRRAAASGESEISISAGDSGTAA